MSHFWTSRCRCGTQYEPFDGDKPIVAVVCSCGHVNIMHHIDERSQRTAVSTSKDALIHAKPDKPKRKHLVTSSDDFRPGTVVYFRDGLTSVGRVDCFGYVNDFRSYRRFSGKPCWTTADEYDRLCASGQIKIPLTLKRK